MKAFFPIALIAALPVSAGSPEFARIEPDQASYAVGAKAVVFAYLDRRPVEERKELFLTVSLAGETVNMIPLSEKLAVALPSRFSEPGVFPLESNVYLQDRAQQAQLLSAIALQQREIDVLARELEKERDSEARKILERRIAGKRQRIAALEAQRERARSLIEVGVRQITVLPASRVKASAIFTLSADRDPAVYGLGEAAAFTAHLHSSFEGPDGPKEPIFRGAIGEASLPAPTVNGSDFTFTTPIFAELGAKEFTASLFVRSQAQSDLLRNAHVLARKQRNAWQKELSAAVEPAHRAYLEWKIGEMSRVIAALSTQLEEILLPVDSVSLEFSVEAGASGHERTLQENTLTLTIQSVSESE